MNKFLGELRVSVMSVHERWWYAYLVAFFIQMAIWTTMVAWDETVRSNHATVVEYIRAVGEGSSPMVQMFVLNSIIIIELGRLIMVLAQGIADRLKERREKFKAELISRGRVEGKAEGKAELAAKVNDWNKRRLEAEARGEGFDEPPPTE
ncbi:MAG: hypothetical protein F4Y49_01810 [Dehalococcoidia bacterium]|nr:hypothetical protein [Dehalococcoidia bacterium]